MSPKIFTVCEGIEIKEIGLRPGEKLNETLVSKRELKYTNVLNNHIFIFNDIQPKRNNLEEEHSSLTAEKMTREELNLLICLHLYRTSIFGSKITHILHTLVVLKLISSTLYEIEAIEFQIKSRN